MKRTLLIIGCGGRPACRERRPLAARTERTCFLRLVSVPSVRPGRLSGFTAGAVAPRNLGALALGLWLAATIPVFALTATNAHSAPATASVSPGSTLSTPVAPMASMVSPPSEEDIRDIRSPKHLPTPWSWVAAAAGVVTFLVTALLLWLRRKRTRDLLPHELALRQLAEARSLMDPGHAREYCFEVSRIIRRYIEAQFQLRAPRLTTEEFLRELVEAHGNLLADHRDLLGDFLRHCDLAKFANWRYATSDLEAMHGSAGQFVEQTAADRATVARERNASPDTNMETAFPQNTATQLNR